MTNSQNIMYEAIKCAEEASDIGEVPVGAIIYDTQIGQIISKSFNKTNKNLDPTAHAEINVIREACKKLDSRRLINCDLYVTLEPCLMCAAAISQAKIRRLYFGADDLKYGSINGNINYFQKENTNHLPEIYDNICSESCNRLLINFFKERR
ncbi:nucleoside deaminase [Pelagibacteraceae bacterium]|nr:nucleoside deaminase [Pelagibacteraceae bacterium]